MGWSYGPKPASPKAYLDGLLTHSSERGTMRCLRSAFVGLTYYAAVERTTPTEPRHVFAAVILVRYTRDGDMGEKCMDETVGPVEARCPKTILALLTPTTNEYALEWRKRCQAHHDRAAAVRLAAMPGTVVQYGGNRYRLDTPAGSPGAWRVTALSDGRTYTMRRAQLAASTPV